MNYLAHIYLSGDDEALKIGNFIADSVKGKEHLKYPTEIQQGILLHRAIDSFTDSHEIFKASSSRLFPDFRHYSPVIVDMFYDHFLAVNWNRYSDIPLSTYTKDFYKLLQDNFQILPQKVQNFLPYMMAHNWLLSYADLDGLRKILSQMSRRVPGEVDMGEAVENLKADYKIFESEFFIFFEELKNFTAGEIKLIKS